MKKKNKSNPDKLSERPSKKPSSIKCDAMEGLIADASEMMEHHE